MERHVELLRRGRLLHLATTDPEGMPHVVPVWYMYRDARIYVGTNTSTVKAQNILRTGRAAACLDEGVHSPLYGVMIRGRAKLITEKERVQKLGAAILLRYFDSLEGPSAKRLLADTDCIIMITPEKFTDWH